MYCIPLQSMFFLLYNALFVTIATSKAQILALRGGGSGRKCTKYELNRTFHSGIDGNYIIWNAILICLNSGISSNAFWIVEPIFGTLLFWPYHLLKAIFQLLKWMLWLQIVKLKDHTLQWYTIHFTSFPNNSWNIWFPKYSKHSVGTSDIQIAKMSYLLSVLVAFHKSLLCYRCFEGPEMNEGIQNKKHYTTQ